MKQNEILRIHGTNYTEMTVQLLEAAGLAEDIMAVTKGIVDPLIGIKPNLVSPTPASFGATTHPEIVEGILLYLNKYGFRNIMICEGSWIGDKTENAFEYCGYNNLARRYGIQLFDTQQDSYHEASCHMGQHPDPSVHMDINAGKHLKSHDDLVLRICNCVEKIDYLINVPVLKGHCQTKITCALKNMKGLIPNYEKRRFHSLGLHKPIAYLNTCIRQDFIVIDHICGDPDFEDGGNPLVTNCIMAAKDPVLTDAYSCRVLNRSPEEVAYILLAESLGVGNADLSDLILTDLNNSDNSCIEEKGLSAGLSEQDTAALAHKILELDYANDEIESCSACYSALIDALNRLNEEGLLHKLTDELHIRFCIGQGYRQKTEPARNQTVSHTGNLAVAHPDDPAAGPDEESPDTRIVNYIGIGSCTGRFKKNIPGCPPSGDDIYQHLRRLI